MSQVSIMNQPPAATPRCWRDAMQCQALQVFHDSCWNEFVEMTYNNGRIKSHVNSCGLSARGSTFWFSSQCKALLCVFFFIHNFNYCFIWRTNAPIKNDVCALLFTFANYMLSLYCISCILLRGSHDYQY